MGTKWRSDGTLFMYGPDADKLFAVVRPILEACSFMQGASVTLRYGPQVDGVRESTVRITSWYLVVAPKSQPAWRMLCRHVGLRRGCSRHHPGAPPRQTATRRVNGEATPPFASRPRTLYV